MIRHVVFVRLDQVYCRVKVIMRLDLDIEKEKAIFIDAAEDCLLVPCESTGSSLLSCQVFPSFLAGKVLSGGKGAITQVHRYIGT